MPSSSQSDISTLDSASLTKLSPTEFESGITAMDGPRLQKFHSLRKLTEQQDKLVRERLATLGLTAPQAEDAEAPARNGGLSVGTLVFGGVCLFSPIVGFLAVRLLMG